MNSVTLIGRLGQEVELTVLENGIVANFSIATDDSYVVFNY